MSKSITRRQFWRLHPIEALRTVLTGRGSGEDKRSMPVRPPGAAADEGLFLATCERCHKCSEVCPYDVIGHLGPEWGSAEGTPVLEPEVDPCRWCASFDCIEACPSGALSMGESGVAAPIGRAELNLAACLVTQGILCDVCVYRCPPSIRAITLQGRTPRIDQDSCVGCGLCAYYCAAEPSAIRILEAERTE
jgi:ferredoxin